MISGGFLPALLGGLLSPDPPEQKQALKYPMFEKNPIVALALARHALGLPEFKFENLKNYQRAPERPDFAGLLADAKKGSVPMAPR